MIYRIFYERKVVKMFVLNIISIIDENTNVVLINNDTKKLEAIYDGKDAIPEKYNGWIVDFLSIENVQLPIRGKEVTALAIYAHKD